MSVGESGQGSVQTVRVLTDIVGAVGCGNVLPRFLQCAASGTVKDPHGFVLLVNHGGEVRVRHDVGNSNAGLPGVLILVPPQLLHPLTAVLGSEMIIQPCAWTVGEVRRIGCGYFVSVPVVVRIHLRTIVGLQSEVASDLEVLFVQSARQPWVGGTELHSLFL